MANSPPTVLGVLQQLFPEFKRPNARPYMGWGPKVRRSRPRLGKYATLPLLPFDVFAVAAYLLEVSGAYHHISPVVSADFPSEDGKVLRRLRISEGRIRRARKLAEIWRAPVLDLDESGDLEHMSVAERRAAQDKWYEAYAKRHAKLRRLERLWRVLFEEFGNEPIFVELRATDKPPRWWAYAHFLFMIADEASVHVGFTQIGASASDPRAAPWFEELALLNIYEDYMLRGGDDGEPPRITSLSGAHPDVACVMPKVRTSAVGCTLRSLSHHLALLPPRGVARGHWASRPRATPTDDRELNLLLVPFPFSISDRAFAPGSLGIGLRRNWGFFDVEQTWLYPGDDPRLKENQSDSLSSFVTELALLAEKKHGASEIDGVIFPELALSYDTYIDLRDRLRNRFPGLEIFISGISTDASGASARKGNFVAVTIFDQSPTGLSPFDDDEATDEMVTTIREKHHRWKLDKPQIDAYGLSGGLNPKFEWWENIALLSRRVDFTAFRKRSVIATMLCEDLARVDPCQELLRAVGPSIVVALLMDAPQLRTRWPARYATVLAEDPGSAVLTLTSRALMTRQHLLDKHKSANGNDRVIAIWRDDFSERPTEIACPIDHQAVWLKLWSSPATDYSLDGRDDPHSRSWVYGKHVPLKIDNAHSRYGDLLGEDDARANGLSGTGRSKPDSSA